MGEYRQGVWGLFVVSALTRETCAVDRHDTYVPYCRLTLDLTQLST